MVLLPSLFQQRQFLPQLDLDLLEVEEALLVPLHQRLHVRRVGPHLALLVTSFGQLVLLRSD